MQALLTTALVTITAFPLPAQQQLFDVTTGRGGVAGDWVTYLWAAAGPVASPELYTADYRGITGCGSIDERSYLPCGRGIVPQSTSLHAVDVDGDGSRDLLLVNRQWVFFYRVPSELYSRPIEIPRARYADFSARVHKCGSLVSGDFNGDGKTDIIMGPDDTRDLQLVLDGGLQTPDCTTYVGLGDGAFHFTEIPNSFKHRPRNMLAGDFNGDGKLDLVMANTDGTVSIELNDGTGNFTESWAISGGLKPYGLEIGDINRDGKLDFVFADMSGGRFAYVMAPDKERSIAPDPLGPPYGKGLRSTLSRWQTSTMTGIWTLL